MLDQPELTPEWEAYLKTSTPPTSGSKGKGSLVLRSGRRTTRPRRIRPSQPRTALPTSRRPQCLMPRPVYRPPSRYRLLPLPSPLLRKLTCVFSKFLGKGVM